MSDNNIVTVDGTSVELRLVEIAPGRFEAIGRFRGADIIGQGYTAEDAVAFWTRTAGQIASRPPKEQN